MEISELIKNSILSTRAKNILCSHNIETFDQLKALPEEDLASFRNLGNSTFREIKKYLNKYHGKEIKYIITTALNDTDIVSANGWYIKDGCLVIVISGKDIKAYAQGEWLKICEKERENS